MVQDAGQECPRITDKRQQQRRQRQDYEKLAVFLLSVQVDARQPSDGRAQARVRHPGRGPDVSRTDSVPAAGAARQDQNGSVSGRHDLRHQDHDVQVQVHPVGPTAREQSDVRAHSVVTPRRFVQVRVIHCSNTHQGRI